MTRPAQDLAAGRLLDYLGELGPRWGLPDNACRVHGYLYLLARPVSAAELTGCLGIDDDALAEAIGWLGDYGLIEIRDAGWRTDADPWSLLTRALEARWQRELGPARAALAECRRNATASGGVDPTVRAQMAKLEGLIDDLASIAPLARDVSGRRLRLLVALAGGASRFILRTKRGRAGT